MWVDVWCRPRVGCNSVTQHHLHSLSVVLNNLEVQLYNSWTTDWHQRQGLESTIWHRRLPTNLSDLCLWLGVYLASVWVSRRHKALAAKVSIWHIQTMDTVSDINSPACDVTTHQSTDTVWLRWHWTETCSTTRLHQTTSRRGVTNWNFHHQSVQWTTGAASTHRSQHCWSTTSSVQSFTWPHSRHRRRL